MWIRVVSVRARLLFGFSLLLLLLLVVGGLAAQRLAQLRATIHIATHDVPERVDAANTLIDAVNEGARAKLSLFAARSPELADSSTKKVAKARERINLAYAQLDRLFDPKQSTDKESIQALEEVKRLRKIHASSFDSAAKVKERGDVAEADRLLGNQVLPSLSEYISGIKRLTAIQEEHMKAEAAGADASASASQTQIVWLCGLATLIGLFIARAIYQSVTVPLARLTVAARALAEGECDVQVSDGDSRDEVGKLAAAMTEMATAERALAVTAQRLAAGDVTAEVVVRGNHDVLGTAMVRLKETLGSLDAAIGTLSQAAREGRLAERAAPERFQGAFRGLVSGLNATLDAIVAPVGEARSSLQAVANRDLSARMPEHFAGDHKALARTFNTATQALDQTLLEVHDAAEQVRAASSQIADGAQSLAQGASEQAASLDRVHVNLQQLGSETHQNAGRAEAARSLAVQALQSSERGTAEMERLSKAMLRIRESSTATARILKTIDEIAFQTNLLALNAAVESARAGEAGRGFAVVAEQVRTLAQRSAEAAKQTSRLIQESVESAEQGASIERTMATELAGVATQVHKVGSVLTDVADACGRQRDDIGQVTRAFDELNGTTQQAAATAEESASAAEELAGQATMLTEMVSTFQLSHRKAEPAKLARHRPASLSSRARAKRFTA